MTHRKRRSLLAERLVDRRIPAMLVTRLVNVRYLTGFTGSNAQVLLRSDGSTTLFTDGRYEEQSAREAPDLERMIYPRSFPAIIAGASRDLDSVGFEEAGVSYRIFRELEDAGMNLVPTHDLVEALRWSKDEGEREKIAAAQELTDQAFDRLLPKLAEGVTERQAAFELELAMRESGAEKLAFETIAAFGENAAEPHHHPTDRRLRPGDVVKLDFGCVVDGYHSDMTRTVAFGDPGPEMREVHEIVLRAQLAGIEAVRAGAAGDACDAAARTVIAEAGFGDRFGHSLGHGVGLEIHEGPTLRRGSTDVLPTGTVVTVEPGIYLPGRGGVRIEDMVEVTDDGCRPIPRTTKDLVIL